MSIQTNLTEKILSDTNVGSCFSHDEAFGVAEAVLLNYYGDSNLTAVIDVGSMASLLCDYTPETIDLSEAESIVHKSIDRSRDDETDEDQSSRDEEDNDSAAIRQEEPSDGDEDLSDGDCYIQDGECELCERHMKLTRHHLIPKETWGRIKPRMMDAAEYYASGDFDKASEIMRIGIVPHALFSSTCLDSSFGVRLFLGNYTAQICRHCHSMVHRFFSNLELAEQYNTVEKLLGDERVYKYCKWSNKQKPGKYKN